MKKAGFIAIFLVLLFSQPVLARSGCCSYHQGVRADGCGCNDGTPLSSTCAPYYACTANEQAAPVVQQNYPVYTPVPTVRIFVPTKTPTPTPTNTPKPTQTIKPTPTKTVKKAVKKAAKKAVKHRSFWDWIFGWNK